jgi:probable HAF family extracellular repeat protein
MFATRRIDRRSLAAALVLVGLVAWGCGGEPSTAPDLARGSGGGGKGPTVRSTKPPSAPRGTTLNVQVLGSGFDQGSRAVWALNGDTLFTTTKIKTNTTSFVSSTELVANITIDADASLDVFDVVVVTLSNKKGIGIELFTVTLQIIDLGVGDGSFAQAINDENQIVGWGGTASGAFFWQNFVVTDLGALPGNPGAQAEDINASGWIVGISSSPSGARAVLWKPKASGGYNPPVDLGTLGGSSSEATAINGDGVIAGSSALPGDAGSHAVIWDANGVIHDIQTIVGGSSIAWGMNDLGQVVGQWDGPSNQQAFRYTPGTGAGTGMELLSGIGGPQGLAIDINGTGKVVGWSEPSPGAGWRATLWEGGTATDLGTLGGSESVAIAITDDGRVVGRSTTGVRRSGAFQYVGFLWTATEGMKSLGLSPGIDYAQASGINANGWVVGESWAAKGNPHATLWRPQ